MQRNYTPKMNLRKKIATGVIVGLTALVEVFNGGCGWKGEDPIVFFGTSSRLEKYKITAKTDSGKLDLCGCYYLDGFSSRGPFGQLLGIGMDNSYAYETNSKNREFMDEMCKQGISSYGKTPNENFREQGKILKWKMNSPVTKVTYDQNFVFFSKGDFSERYAAQLKTLEAYEHIKDDKWEHSEFMTKWARGSGDFNKTLNQISAQANANNINNTNKSQEERNADVMDNMKGKIGAGIALQGLLKAAADYAKP